MLKFQCPYCNSSTGYLTKQRVTLCVHFSPEGDVLKEEITGDKNNTGRTRYCQDCKREIDNYVVVYQGCVSS